MPEIAIHPGFFKILSDDREKIFADCTVDGERPAADAEEGKSRRPDHQRKLQIEKSRFADGKKHSGHDQDNANSRKAGEKTEEEAGANDQFREHKQRSNNRRTPKPGRRCPCLDRPVPSGSREPTECHLGSMKEKNGGGRHPQDERPRISRGVEEMEDGIVRHGNEH